jgi:hypothetical protein
MIFYSRGRVSNKTGGWGGGEEPHIVYKDRCMSLQIQGVWGGGKHHLSPENY